MQQTSKFTRLTPNKEYLKLKVEATSVITLKDYIPKEQRKAFSITVEWLNYNFITKLYRGEQVTP